MSKAPESSISNNNADKSIDSLFGVEQTKASSNLFAEFLNAPKEAVKALPDASEDLLNKSSAMRHGPADKVVGADRFPDMKIEGALLADTKFKPSDSMSTRLADRSFDQMTQGKGRIPLDALYQLDSTKKVA